MFSGKLLLPSKVILLQQEAIDKNNYSEFTNNLTKEILHQGITPKNILCTEITFLSVTDRQVMSTLIGYLIFQQTRTGLFRSFKINQQEGEKLLSVTVTVNIDNIPRVLKTHLTDLGITNVSLADDRHIAEARLQELQDMEDAYLQAEGIQN
jgi:hypothetical protein